MWSKGHWNISEYGMQSDLQGHHVATLQTGMPISFVLLICEFPITQEGVENPPLYEHGCINEQPTCFPKPFTANRVEYENRMQT